jgi:dolichyl-phosphate-mannose--protein O-mannosyl transferase
MTARRSTWALVIVIAATATIYGLRLGQPSWGPGPPHYVFDEKYTAFTAHRVLTGDPAAFEWAARRYEYVAAGTDDLSLTSRTEWTSPPGAPLAVAPFIAAFGFSAAAARAASVVAALVVLLSTAWLARREQAWWACALLGFDGAFFVLARTAMPYMFLVAGLTLGAALLMHALRSQRHGVAALIGAGVAFGFAVSVRLTAVPIGLALLGAAALSKEATGKPRALPMLMVVVVALGAYLATFAPYLAHGHTLADVVRFHRALSWFHRHVPHDFPYSTPWYEWPWVRHPVVFATREGAGRTAVVVCMGGRLLWWALVPAQLYALWRARERTAAVLLPLAGILATWLPWGAVNRFGLSYYMLPALPWTALLVAGALPGPRGRRFALFYLVAALVLFALTYPVLAAVPLSAPALARYRSLLGF